MNNEVKLIGKLGAPFIHSHCCSGIDFYASEIGVKRYSGIFDVIPIVVSQELLQTMGGNDFHTGDAILIQGSYRSVNYWENGKSHLKLYVHVNYIEHVVDREPINMVYLDGWVVKPPIFRTTPLGCKITDIIIAVHRNNGSSDYIPCIAWYVNAERLAGMKVGDEISFSGRIQSRKYVKKLENGNEVDKEAYEVSIKNFI